MWNPHFTVYCTAVSYELKHVSDLSMLVLYFRGHAFVVYLRTIKVHNDSVFKELTVHFLLQKSHLWNPPHAFGFPNVQYRSKVSWQSLEPWSSSLETRYSILDNFEYRVLSLEDRVSSLESRVSSLESRVSSLESRKLMSLALDWSLEKLIAQTGRKPNTCTCRLSVLRAIVPLTLEIRKQIIYQVACDQFDCKHR